MDKPKLLIVDDDESIQLAMKWSFAQEFAIFLAGNRQEALEVFRREHPALVTLDLGLPPAARGVEEGFLTLSALMEEDPFSKVIIISGQGEKQNALTAIGHGAYDFFCKPVQVEEVSVILRRALRVHQLESEHRQLQASRIEDFFEELLGTSPQMQQVFSTIEKVAGTEAPVLILGESGTGKELIARALHGRSQRKGKAFVAINCAAIPENLLESELFGHEKGAYTGAHTQRKGRIEMADGGTLFLDEIGDLPPSLQVKLLRFLQEHTIERIGGRKEIPISSRVIAATNKDLDLAILDGSFREDLYYRLGVVRIQVPPLRDREGDVALLATSFVRKYAEENKKKILGFSKNALTALTNHKWPGNVRELENRIRRAVIMAPSSKITGEDLELETGTKISRTTLREAREKTDRTLILQVLTDNNFNLAKSAAELGISRPSLYDLMEKLNIKKIRNE
ncbi:MAG: PEP-CTERM-box response regulator transcription factor [Syntrophobacteraceae bacterium]